MWLQFEVVRGPVGVVWGRFGPVWVPKGSKPGGRSFLPGGRFPPGERVGGGGCHSPGPPQPQLAAETRFPSRAEGRRAGFTHEAPTPAGRASSPDMLGRTSSPDMLAPTIPVVPRGGEIGAGIPKGMQALEIGLSSASPFARGGLCGVENV